MDDQAFILCLCKKFIGFSALWKESLTFLLQLMQVPQRKLTADQYLAGTDRL